MFQLSKNHLRSGLRQALSWATIAALIACSVGFPLPASVEKETAVPYPCMNSPCGCKDAEYCWRNCCCHSLQEKLAWARDNGVAPPAYVLAAVERPACCKKDVQKNVAKTCCSAHARPIGCASGQVCQKTKSLSKPGTRSRTVISFEVLNCRGHAASFSLLPPSVLNWPLVPAFFSAPSGAIALGNDLFAPRSLAGPDTPPPQQSV